MKTVIIALFIAAVVSSAAADVVGETPSHRNLHLINKHVCGDAYQDRIFSPNAYLGEFPWMALLTYQREERLTDGCIGTLITDKYILTAAHCINNKLKEVRLGDWDRSTYQDCETINPDERICSPPTQNFTVKRTIVHPLYSQRTHQNDIALIELSNPANLTDEVKPVCLPVGEETSALGQRMDLSTWNLRDANSTLMLKAHLQVLGNAQCNSAYQAHKVSISDKQFCATGGPNCSAYGGSPLQNMTPELHRAAKYKQYGIVSFGPARCGTNNIPDVYTDVRQYITWILDSITA